MRERETGSRRGGGGERSIESIAGSRGRPDVTQRDGMRHDSRTRDTRRAKASLTLTLARVWLVDCMTSWQRRMR